MFPQTGSMPSTKAIISAAASTAATAMLIRSVARDFLPSEFSHYMFSYLRFLMASFSSELTIVIEEYEGLNINHLFNAAELYLEPSIPPTTRRIKATKAAKEGKISLSIENNEEVIDKFNGIQLKWRRVIKQIQSRLISSPDRQSSALVSELRSFELSFHKKHKDMVVETYLPYVLEKSKRLKEKKKTLKLHTLRYGRMQGRRGDAWQSANLHHPATFETLAMDSDVKTAIIEDLERFTKRKEYYRRVGKAWKRGYLLFGPPGTGKSSLIAAMANYLNFDVYDLELTELRGNNELRKLLISTANKSILVVEDIDCSIELQDRLTAAQTINRNGCYPGYHEFNASSQVTLSGLLNFIDGLWSSCGDERIIVFTTNAKNKLDPALLRPGRMDVHIHMSYCTPGGFRTLAANYLQIAEHSLFAEIEDLILKTKVTPAEVGEQLMKHEIPESALQVLLDFLEGKKKASEVTNEESSGAEGKAKVTEIIKGEKGGNEALMDDAKEETVIIQ